MAKEEEIKLKDMLRAIEAGEIEEDLDLPDPEQYDDMGGIKSLGRSAPSIKMASETPEEEFGLELDSLYREWKDKIEKGLFDGPFEDYADKYFSYKKQMNEDRKMAMYGGRMQYGDGTDLRNKMSKLMIKAANGTITDKEMIELRNMESAGMFSRANNAYGGRMQYGDGTDKDEIPKRLSIIEKDYPDAIKKRYNFMDLIDKEAEDEYYKIKEEKLDRKYNPKNYPPSQRNMSTEELKKMLKKAEEDKVKKAKGGIAGVL